MPSFLGGSSSPFDEIIEKATNETNTSENWGLILDICDKIGQGGSKTAKDGLLSIKKRLNHRDPHVVMLALSVLDSCMSNCGITFQREVCTREFISELRSKATGSNHKIAEKARLLIKKWAKDECKSDASLGLIPSLYSELKKDGHKFESSDPPAKKVSAAPADPNYVSSKEEEEAIAKAIQESLKDSSSAEYVKIQTQPLYPTGSVAPPPARMVKALYDFEAAEDNELTFKAGEMITILDDSDLNWWRGSNHRGEGLFPASFVTADLTAPVEQIVVPSDSGKKRSVQFDENVAVKEMEPVEEPEPPRIDEDKLSHCLQLLEDADPTGERPDPPELPGLEEQCHAMGPLIDSELADIDRQHNCLAEVDVKLREALSMYDAAMKDASVQFQTQLQSFPVVGPGGNMLPQTSVAQPPLPQNFDPSIPEGNIQQQGGVEVRSLDPQVYAQVAQTQQQQPIHFSPQHVPRQIQSLPPGLPNVAPDGVAHAHGTFVQYQ